MFTTFSGNSRRPRQVNLSGRTGNPFTSIQQSSPAPSPQAAVAHAHQERKARQQEREKLQAAQTVQRTWRGYHSRKRLREIYRREWDEQENGYEGRQYDDEAEAYKSLLLLTRFATTRDDNDIRRVSHYASRFIQSIQNGVLSDLHREWKHSLARLARISLESLKSVASRQLPASEETATLLRLLSLLCGLIPDELAEISLPYFSILRELLLAGKVGRNGSEGTQELVSKALLSFLTDRTASTIIAAYLGFVTEILTIPKLYDHLDSNSLFQQLDSRALAKAIVRSFAKDPGKILLHKSDDEIKWLFYYFIQISRLTKTANMTNGNIYTDEMDAMKLLLMQTRRTDKRLLSEPPTDLVSTYLEQELSNIYEQDTISAMLSNVFQERGSIHDSESKTSAHSGTVGVSAVAGFLLALLKSRSKQADKFLTWMYRAGSLPRLESSDQSLQSVPAIRYLWVAVAETSTFRAILSNSSATKDLIRQYKGAARLSAFHQDEVDRDWEVILIFFEIYAFTLRFLDDEEFINGASSLAPHKSWSQRSALPLSDVNKLTLFLKNLAFAMYWNPAQSFGTEDSPSSESLASYFAGQASTSRSSHDTSLSKKPPTVHPDDDLEKDFASLKGQVTGLLRMLYERDSRRAFLPKDHWLMIKHMDMESFISAVVQEEIRKNQVGSAGEEEDDFGEGKSSNEDEEEQTLVGTSRTQQVRRNERRRLEQRLVSRKKLLEALTPRLEILQNLPFFIPFATRVEIFRRFVSYDQHLRRGGYVDPDQWRFAVASSPEAGGDGRPSGAEMIERHRGKVRRDNIFEDAFERFYPLGDGLKEPIQITFVDQFDTPEAGIDGGGVTKEFLTSITNEAFEPSPDNRFFVENDQHLLYPNPTAYEERRHLLQHVGVVQGSDEWKSLIREFLQRFEFLGRVIGKCLYEGILVDVHFAPFFLVKWALTGGSGSARDESGYRATINDLRDLDEGLYQGLLQLKNYPGNVEDLSLDFTITDTFPAPDGNGIVTKTHDLQPNGSSLVVNNENRLIYIYSVAHYRLRIQPELQTKAFLRGLSAMIQPSWLSMFNQSELQNLLGGDSSEIDVNDLRRNTLYGGVYQIGTDGLEHPTVTMFWEVMQSFADSERRKLLKYVTSTPRGPLLGFAKLNPSFSIRDSGSDQDRLPSTSTCVNLLKLPIYRNKETLRQKLLLAINSGAGFDLS